MAKIKFDINTTAIDVVEYSSDVHYRIFYRKSDNSAVAVCVQDFDYIDYDEFIGNVLFSHEEDAEKAAKKINKLGVQHFRD